MSEIVFLVEEPSMKEFLNIILPKVLPDNNYTIIKHEGKHDLERSIPRKLRAFRQPEVQFVILMDQDSNDCFDVFLARSKKYYRRVMSYLAVV